MLSTVFILIYLLMDSTLFLLQLFYFILKFHLSQSEDDSPPLSSSMVETQYLTYDMSQYGSDGGVFSSPNFPNYYPQDTIIFYQFKANAGHRVQIEIDFFQIRGVTPQCTHDYLDVFLNVTDFNSVHSLLHDQLLHRYCGRNKPPLLISFTNLLVLGFFTEDTQTERGFNGSFRFISAQPYRNHLLNEPCDYLFNSSISKRGELFSSTYPGTYLPWQFCNYSFVGQPGERIHIRFRDLMIFKTPTSQHCAVDLIKLYDETLDPIELRRFISNFRQNSFREYSSMPIDRTDQHHITDLCGSYSLPLDVYSSSHRLLLYFLTTHYAEITSEDQLASTDRSTLYWRKGFYAEYEFVSSLTKLDFIPRNKANQYVSGTECDQTIKSFSQGHGKFSSPNWPQMYRPQTSCSTYLLGLDDRYTLENVEIEFDQFDIDCHLVSLVIYNASRIYDSHSSTITSTLSSTTLTQKTSSFSHFYRQDLDFRENLSFCGHFKPEGRFISQSSLLKISFIPNDRTTKQIFPSLIHGGKYQIRYKFVKSYHQISADEYDGIHPNVCNLSYFQIRSSSGKFEPPRSSQNDYFSNSNCTFNFYPIIEQSRVLIWYDYFNIVDENYLQCTSDNLTYSYRLSLTSRKHHQHPFVYCGYRNFPPPYLTIRSTEEFRVHFRSNDDSDAALGFDGRYVFVNRSHPLFSTSCSSPFDPINYLNENEQNSGNLTSNGYPENVICEWSFSTNRDLHFNLHLNLLELEGSKIKDPPQGCQSSVLRIFSEGQIDEFCGQQEKPFFYLTNSNWFTVQFISLTRLTKEPLRGFQLSWTIVRLKDFVSSSLSIEQRENQFDCNSNGHLNTSTSFYIDRSLVCDGYVHCQPISNEDELVSLCSQSFDPMTKVFSSSFKRIFRKHFIFILGVCFVVVLLICSTIICVCLIQKHKQRRILSERNSSNNDDDDDDEDEGDEGEETKDFLSFHRFEQAVTTV